ncbi:UDP-N-acetylglucosamine 2-epimerase, partial [Clostridium sp.]
NSIDFKNKKIIMVTAHRRENWGIGIENICKALKIIVEENSDVEILYLVHPNPVVKDMVYSILKDVSRIHLLSPIDTREIHNLMKKCYLVMTDSGGIQEEAPHLGKPVLVLRDVTERVEALGAGTVRLVGIDIAKIVLEANSLIRDVEKYNHMSKSINPYGDGNASIKIVNALVNYFNNVPI